MNDMTINNLDDIVKIYKKWFDYERLENLYTLFTEQIYSHDKRIAMLHLRFKLADMTGDMTDTFDSYDVINLTKGDGYTWLTPD